MTSTSPSLRPFHFSDALRVFDHQALRALLAADPVWPPSPSGLPAWVWVVDNALLRLNDRTGMRRNFSDETVIAGLKAQLDLLLQSGQDASAQVISDRNAARVGGCVHHLLTHGSVQNQPAMQGLAQCVLEAVPEVALTLRDDAGRTPRDLLDLMRASTQWAPYHNLPAFVRAWSAREALHRQTHTQETGVILPSARTRLRP